MKDGALQVKSFAFAVRVVNLNRFLCAEKKEFVLSKQLLRSGTAIGALVREAEQAESKRDFVHKLAIALKEANGNRILAGPAPRNQLPGLSRLRLDPFRRRRTPEAPYKHYQNGEKNGQLTMDN
jgi:hypothetical protein